MTTLIDKVKEIIEEKGRVIPENLSEIVEEESSLYDSEEKYLEEIRNTFEDWYEGFAFS